MPEPEKKQDPSSGRDSGPNSGHSLRHSLGQTLSRWASQDREHDRELRQGARKAGLVCIADAPLREKVVVQGTLKTVTLRPRGGVPALEAELYDGTGSINVIWLGRRRISGISPGRSIRVAGRIGEQDGDRIMFNPRYDLRFQ